jgi:hypothetical protein
MDREYRYRHSSFFFPIALITAGVVWLLVNNGTIPVENLYRLVPFWPVLLIMAGLSLLFRRIWWPLNALMWAVVAVLVVWLLTTGSAFLPKLSPLELKHETLHEALGAAKSGAVSLNLSIRRTTVHALEDSNDLLLADVYSVNGVVLDASGADRKNVELHEDFRPDNFVFNPRIDQWFDSASKPWDIGLTPKIPLALSINAGTGRTDLNLAGLKLESLKVNVGTGSMGVVLPGGQAVGQASLPVDIDGGTGGITVRLPDNTPVELKVNGGTGGLQINLPAGAGVQVEVRNGGLGGLHLPDGFTKVSGNVQDKEGTWQNAAYSGSKTPVKIILDIGTGGVTIQ